MSSEIINNRYLVIRKLGQSPNSIVFLVEDTLFEGREIALKKISGFANDAQKVKEFKREFEIMARLRHPNLVQVYDFGYDVRDYSFFLTMEFVGINTLHDKLLKEGKIKLEQAIEYLVILCRALAYIHSKNILHGDVKPSNIVISPNSFKLSDFGIANIINKGRRQSRATMLYMAPEVLEDKSSYETDIFSLGVTFFHLLTALPFYLCQEKREIIDLVRNKEDFNKNQIESISKIKSKPLRKILSKMTAFDSKARFHDTSSIIKAINSELGMNFELETSATKNAYISGNLFTGKEKEFNFLKSGLNDNKFYLLEGDEGSGKRKLIEEFRKYCQINEYRFVKGKCFEKISRPYNPILEFIHQTLPILSIDKLQYFGPSLIKLLPNNSRLKKFKPLMIDNTRLEKELLISTICDYLEEISKHSGSGLVLFFMDLQWADELTLETLKDIVNRLLNKNKINKIHCCGSIQIENSSNFHIFLKNKLNINTFIKLQLSKLTEKKAIEYIKAFFGNSAIGTQFKETISELVTKSQGNRSFFEEFIRILVDKNFIARINKKWEIVKPLSNCYFPQSHDEIIINKLKTLHLNQDEMTSLQFLSLLNRSISVDDFQFLLSDKIDITIRDFFNKLEEYNILRVDPLDKHLQYSFANNMICKVIKKRIVKTTEMHLYIARRLEKMFHHRIDDYVEELAFHYSQTGKNDKTLLYLEKAADKARKEFANEEAISYYNSMIYLLKQDNPEKKFNILFKIGRIYELIGKWTLANEIFKDCLNLAQNINNELLQARCNQNIGRLCGLKADYQLALAYHQKAVTVFNKLNSKQDIAGINNDFGNIYTSLGRYDDAMSCFKKRLAIEKSLNNKLGISQVINNIGNIYLRKSQYKLAMDFYQKKLQMDKELNNLRGQSIALINIGLIFKDRGELDKAFECQNKTLDYTERLGDKRLNAFAIGNMGDVFFSKNMYDKAMEYYQKCFNIVTELGDKRGIAGSIGSMGNIHLIQGNFEEAEKCFTKTLSLAQRQEDVVDVCVSYGLFGKLYHRQQKLDKALTYYNQAISLSKNLHYKQFTADVLFEKANLFFSDNKFTEAKTTNKKAQSLAKQLSSNELIFSTEILMLKIQCALKPDEKEVVLNRLFVLLENCNDEIHESLINYTLFQITKQKENGLRAIELYKKWFLKTKNIVYKNRVKEISKILKLNALSNV